MGENINLTLIHSNDFHGDFLAKEEDGIQKGGIALLSGYVQEQRDDKENVIYAIAGDMFRGSVIDSEYKGLSTIELMNRLMPDVVTIGNHEVDYGLAHLLFIEKCARFPIINANLFIKTNHVRLFNPYIVLERGGIKVLFIGIITDEILASQDRQSPHTLPEAPGTSPAPWDHRGEGRGETAYRRTDGRHDAFANAGDNRLFAGTTDELLDAGAHGNTGNGVQLDTVKGHCGNLRGRDDLRVHGHLHGLEHVTAGKVDGGCFLEVELDVCLVGGNERLNHAQHVTAAKVVGFEQVRIDREASLAAEDSGFHDDLRGHLTQAHTDELEDAHVCLGEQGLEPEAEELADKGEEDDDGNRRDNDSNDKECIHCLSPVLFFSNSTKIFRRSRPERPRYGLPARNRPSRGCSPR